MLKDTGESHGPQRMLADGYGNLRIKSGFMVVHSLSCRPYDLFRGYLCPGNMS
jgi:hypothetical protein